MWRNTTYIKPSLFQWVWRELPRQVRVYIMAPIPATSTATEYPHASSWWEWTSSQTLRELTAASSHAWLKLLVSNQWRAEPTTIFQIHKLDIHKIHWRQQKFWKGQENLVAVRFGTDVLNITGIDTLTNIPHNLDVIKKKRFFFIWNKMSPPYCGKTMDGNIIERGGLNVWQEFIAYNTFLYNQLILIVNRSTELCSIIDVMLSLFTK